VRDDGDVGEVLAGERPVREEIIKVPDAAAEGHGLLDRRARGVGAWNGGKLLIEAELVPI